VSTSPPDARVVARAVPLVVAAVLVLLALMTPPAAWQAVGVAALLMALAVVTPRLVVRVVERVERFRGASAGDTDPVDGRPS
jgi:hypothetical protein